MKFNRFLASIVAGTALLGGLVGCNDEDFIEEHSYKYDDGSFYTSESDMEMGIAACYAEMQYLMYGNMHTAHSWMIQGVGLDTFAQTSSNDCFSNWRDKMLASNGYSRHWFDYGYVLINRCNTVIDMIDERTSVEYSTATKKNELRAEAVFLRAWAYRFLAGMFGNVVIMEHRTTEARYDYAPNTRQEVWEFVKSDLQFAAENLPTTPRKLGCVTRAAADAYLAEICLALGDFQEAVDAATRVISKQDGNYQIMTTRFGSRKDEKTDRYGNALNPYWDLFRGSWGNNGSGAGVKKADDSNPNSADNLEAIWVAQFNYGTYSTGGGGDSWWRTHCSAVETSWSSSLVIGNQTTRAKKNGDKFYVLGDDVACFAEGVNATSNYSDIPGCGKRHVANIARDSSGARVSYLGTICIPNEYVYGELWDDPNDFRGSEVMIQRNMYVPGGRRWFDVKKEMYARAEAAKGTEDEAVMAVQASDTTALFPRLWKLTDDFHPNGNNKEYDVDWYMLRVPEVYLLRAEAYLALNQKGKAAEDINVVRRRAGAKDCTADQINIDYILDERTRELLIEEDRWITLNRLSVNPNCTYISDCYPVQDETTSNTMYERVRKYGFGYENVANNESYGRDAYVDKDGKTRHHPNFRPFNYQYPIPTQVIQSNKDYEYPQNTGYSAN